LVWMTVLEIMEHRMVVSPVQVEPDVPTHCILSDLVELRCQEVNLPLLRGPLSEATSALLTMKIRGLASHETSRRAIAGTKVL